MRALEIYQETSKWAVVGVNLDPEKYGNKIYKKLKEKNKIVYGISPKYAEIDGDKLYKDLGALPEKVDVVVFVVNPAIGKNVLGTMKNLGINKVWLQPGTIDDELLEIAKEYEIETIEACVLVVASY